MTNKELLRHNSFLITQIDLTQRRIIQPVFRGDSLSSLCDRLNITFDKDSIDIGELLKRLFMVGEKSRRFLTLNENFNIDNVDDYVFEKIFKYFEDSLRNKKPAPMYFFQRNSSLKSFFSDKYNKEKFLEIISKATEDEKLKIRNYYLTLLHQLAAINYKNKSHFVSTSSDYKIAQAFSERNKDPNRIILHCWQPIKRERQIIKHFGLPNYFLGPFSYQNELSILGGILPHYISGIEIKLTNKFYPNPFIFENKISEETFLNGLEIDQRNFDKILELTNYKNSLISDGQKVWERVPTGLHR